MRLMKCMVCDQANKTGTQPYLHHAQLEFREKNRLFELFPFSPTSGMPSPLHLVCYLLITTYQRGSLIVDDEHYLVAVSTNVSKYTKHTLVGEPTLRVQYGGRETVSNISLP